MTSDVLILGGGVIGLSLAWDLAKHGLHVTILERSEPGRESSWAGAGILPPAAAWPAARELQDLSPTDRLAALSMALHPLWSRELREATRIDNQFAVCGAWYLAGDAESAAEISIQEQHWHAEGIAWEDVDPRRIATHPQGIGISSNGIVRALFQPAEAQLRNPRHLQALVVACQQRGVTIVNDCAVERFHHQRGRVNVIATNRGEFPAARFCLCAGAWSGALARDLGVIVPIRPIRGQMLLYDAPHILLPAIVNWGLNYLVPRRDGLILVGSTLEDVGFEKRTTDAGLAELRGLARRLVPALAEAEEVQAWSGLRPAPARDRPYLGPLPGWENVWIAAGHYRSGIHWSPGTAVVMSALIRDVSTPIEMTLFAVE